MTSAPHLLYVAWGFPPSRAGGVYRALATVNAFAAQGWRVTVLTADRETYARYTGADPSLEAQVDPRIEVVRVPFDWPAQDTDVRRYSFLRVALPPVWHRIRRLADQIGFPEPSYGPWLPALRRAAAAVHARRPVDLTIATANPHVTFGAAHDLFRRSGVPYVMDYRDAWRLDVFTGVETRRRQSRAGRVEARMIRDAREVWFVNEPIRAWHAAHDPEHAAAMHVVANGWDPTLLEFPLERPDPDGRGIRFAYLGTVTPKVPLAEVLDGWRLALAEGTVPAGSTLTIGGHLGYFSVPQGRLADLVTGAADAGVSYAGPVPKASVGEFYANADVLVLALGSGRYVTSGKVYEYVATGRPIVAVHDAENATTSVLSGHPLVASVTSVDAAGVAAALAEGVRLARSSDPDEQERVRELALAYSRDHQLAPRIAALTESVTR